MYPSWLSPLLQSMNVPSQHCFGFCNGLFVSHHFICHHRFTFNNWSYLFYRCRFCHFFSFSVCCLPTATWASTLRWAWASGLSGASCLDLAGDHDPAAWGMLAACTRTTTPHPSGARTHTPLPAGLQAGERRQWAHQLQ